MAYLNIPTLESFVNEAKDHKVTTIYMAQITARVSETHTISRIVLTAKIKDGILRYIEELGPAMHYDEKEIEKLLKETEKRIKEISNMIIEKGLNVKEGMWEI